MRFIKWLVLIGLIFILTACSQVRSVKTIAEETIREDVMSLVEADVHQPQAIDDFNVKSQIQDGKTITIITTFDFTTDFATVSASVNLTYHKNDDLWIIENKKMTIDSVDGFAEASIEEAQAIIKADPVPFFVLTARELFNESRLSLVNKEVTSESETTFNFQYADQQLNWSLDQSYIVKATFDYRSGWTYQLSDWYYTETSDWSGKWKIEWYTSTGSQVEVYKDIVVTGQLTVTDTKAGNQTVSDPLQVSFTLDGKSYQASGVINPNAETTRRVRIAYGPYSSDWFELYLEITGPFSGSGDAFYGSVCSLNDYSFGGTMTRIK